VGPFCMPISTKSPPDRGRSHPRLSSTFNRGERELKTPDPGVQEHWRRTEPLDLRGGVCWHGKFFPERRGTSLLPDPAQSENQIGEGLLEGPLSSLASAMNRRSIVILLPTFTLR